MDRNARIAAGLAMAALLPMLWGCSSLADASSAAEPLTSAGISAETAPTQASAAATETAADTTVAVGTTAGKTTSARTAAATTAADRKEGWDMTAYDLDRYTAPFWQGSTVFHETVSFIEDEDGMVCAGALLYRPDKILSVRSSDLQTEYGEGRDYTVVGKRLVLAAGSRIRPLAFADYSPEYAPGAAEDWLVSASDPSRYIAVTDRILQAQVAVSYTHTDAWTGQVPAVQIDRLPMTKKKLQKKETLTAVFFGDSITAGWEASGADETCIDKDTNRPFRLRISRAPYMPTWSQMVCDRLQEKAGLPDLIRINRGAGGAETTWGVRSAKELICPEEPDLVFIAFGMNQTGCDGTTFKKDILSVIRTVRQSSPKAEFVLISCMMPNTDARAFAGHRLSEQEQALYALQSELTDVGIAVAPVYSMTKALLAAEKQYGDLSGNNLNHPNDMTIRLYAQTILATLGVV